MWCWLLTCALLLVTAEATWSCPAQFSNGPCFTSAKNWTEAQRTCESHGSNLATILDVASNNELGQGGCFSAAPWNSWMCSWVGLTDLRNESGFQWTSGNPFAYNNWGATEPDNTAGNNQDCAAVCHGGNVQGFSGEFWIDLECNGEYAFCCDEASFVMNAGTPSADSFLTSLMNALAATTTTTTADPDPYAERRLCFSTRLAWADAQKLCASMGTNLFTIQSEAQLHHAATTVHYSRVPASWGLDWKCFWTGFHDTEEEGNYAWVSNLMPTYTPPFGAFEAGNGDGADEDCVALCQSDCGTKNSTECMDLSAYGYTFDFLIDTKCADEYPFCCDELAATFMEDTSTTTTSTTRPASPPVACTAQDNDSDDDQKPLIIVLAILTGVFAVAACVATFCALRLKQANGAPVPPGGAAMIGNSM